MNQARLMERFRQAEKLRRQAAAKAASDALRASYQDGRARGERDARQYAHPVSLPNGFVEEVLRHMAGHFAREAIERVKGDLPYPVVAKVAEAVWSEMRWAGASMDKLAEMSVQREFERGNVKFDLYFPAMRAFHAVDHRMELMLMDEERRKHKR